MRTSDTPLFALGAILAMSLSASAQTGSVRVNAPPPTPVPAGHVMSATFTATPPASATFRGVCSPAIQITFQGAVTTDIAQPDKKKVADQFKVIWSDAEVRDPGRTDSADRRQTTLTTYRFFDKSFDGWVLLQANPWGQSRPHNTPQVPVKVTCEPPVFKQLQHAPGGPQAPPPSTR
jgi:hypothetical protein